MLRHCPTDDRNIGGKRKAVLGQGLPNFEQKQNAVCTGDDYSYLATCETGAVIAVNDIKAGAKLSSKNCPTYYNDTADASCCQYEENDCTFRLGGDVYYNWYSRCTAMEQCSHPGAQVAVTSVDTCGQDHLVNFGLHSQYLLMDYYCIESSIVHSVCRATSSSYTGGTEFLTSPSYPANFSSNNTDCTCSVEVNDCDARIQIYTLHLELSETDGVCGQQSITITDGPYVQNLTCADKSFQGISVKETATSYITLQLRNSEQTDSGRFWLGFTASVNSANVEINCPAQAQKTTCLTTSSSITTTTSSSKPSTSTTSSAAPTSTTNSVTTRITTQSSTTISTATSSTVRTSTTTSSPTPSTLTTSAAAPTTTTQLVTSPMIIKSSTIISTAQSTVSTSTSTTSTTKAASDTNDDNENEALTIVIVIMACVLVVLIIATIVYCCFVRRRFKKMDIEVADLKKKVSGSQIDIPNEHSGSAKNCIKNKQHDTADNTYNTYNETGSLMVNGNRESIIEENKASSSLSKTKSLMKSPSSAKQITGQKKEKVEGSSKYRRTMESCTKTKRNETRKQLNKQTGLKQERFKTLKNDLSERHQLSKSLKSDNIKGDQSTKIDVASESLNLDERKQPKPSSPIRNGKVRPQSRAKSKRLKKPKTPSAKSFRCKRLLKHEIPTSRIMQKTLPEPNVIIQNEAALVKTDTTIEENSCVTDTEKYENDLKTVDVTVDLPQNPGQVNSEDNATKHDLDINKPIPNMSQIITDEMTVQVAGSNSNGAMHIQRQETETFACKNVSKRKRYLRLHRILSSALGYSWSYKEVPKKTKLSKLDSVEINIVPKVLRVELKQGEFLVSENCDNFIRRDGEMIVPRSKIKLGVHDTEDTKSEKITIKKKRNKQRRFRATRIIPKSCPGMTVSNVTPAKAKAHKVKRCHWTHSKF